MLPLVWSTDAAIKEAVVQAYRRLYLNPQGDTVRSVKPTCTVYFSLLNAVVDTRQSLFFSVLNTFKCLNIFILRRGNLVVKQPTQKVSGRNTSINI